MDIKKPIDLQVFTGVAKEHTLKAIGTYHFQHN